MPGQHQLWSTLASRKSLFLIAGPCVIESAAICLRIGRSLKQTCESLGIPYVFKASFDKANRTSATSYRGPGLELGLKILSQIKQSLRVPILTDVHAPEQCAPAAHVADILQIPALLCRQTDLILAAAATGRIVNIQKGQFLSPAEMGQAARKSTEAGGNPRLLLTERGTTFGYQCLVSDMRSLSILRGFGFPVVFDATHSVQIPGGQGDRSSGQREFAPILARAAVAAGADGLFIETHPDPSKALSDGPNMIPLAHMKRLLSEVIQIHQIVRKSAGR